MILMISSSLLKGPPGVICTCFLVHFYTLLFISVYIQVNYVGWIYVYSYSVISATGFVHLQVCISLTISELQDLRS